MNFRIINNNLSNQIVVCDLNELNEAISFFIQNNGKGLKIKSPSIPDCSSCSFEQLDKIKDNLVYLSIDTNGKLKKASSLEPLYQLPKLETLLLAKESIKIDVSKFSNLKYLSIVYSPNIVNFSKAHQINTLVITSGFSKEDLQEISPLNRLSTLHLYKANKLLNLAGIENLNKLLNLKLAYNKNLEDISQINNTKIEKLHLEKCKKLRDLSVLTNLNSLKELFVTEIDSLSFITSLKQLEKIHFWDCKDGDLNPLFNCPSLQSAFITKDKKHYSHKQSEINDYLQSKNI